MHLSHRHKDNSRAWLLSWATYSNSFPMGETCIHNEFPTWRNPGEYGDGLREFGRLEHHAQGTTVIVTAQAFHPMNHPTRSYLTSFLSAPGSRAHLSILGMYGDTFLYSSSLSPAPRKSSYSLRSERTRNQKCQE